MTMITPSYLGETIEYSSLHACRSTLEDPTRRMLLRIDLGGPRARKRIELPDVAIGSIALMGPSLYYVASDAGGDSIWAMPKSGGAPTRLLTAQAGIASAPAFDADSAYFLAADGRLVQAPLHGGPEQTLAGPLPALGQTPVAIEMPVPLPRLVDVDATNVYWLDGARGAVLKVAKQGGVVEVLAGGIHLRDPVFDTRDSEMAVESDYVYFAHALGDVTQVARIAKTGGRIERLMDGPRPRLTMAGTTIFFETGNEVYGLSDSGLRDLGSVGGLGDRDALSTPVRGFAANAEAMFYSIHSDSGDPPMVLRKSSAGGALRILAIGYDLETPVELAADADALYFVGIGTPNGKHGLPRRPGCCAIWEVPR